MKISSKQIIIPLVAFLLGVGGASLIFGDKNSDDTNEKDVAVVETTEGQTDGELTEGAVTTGEAVNTASTKPTTTTTKTTATAKPSNEFVSGKCSTGLSGRKDTKLNAIVLNWSPCASEDFQFYKLVKSSKNSSPSYPADGVAYSSANKNAANFVDKTVASRTTYYYRMCVIQRLGQVNCSNVATVSF